MTNNRLQEVVAGTPPTTLGIFVVCVGVYLLQVSMDLDLERFTMCPRLVFYVHEYYRVVTSTLFHGSFMHIGMNMMSTFHLSVLLEKRLGTLPHLMTTLGAILWTSVVFLGISWTASTVFGYDAWMYQHSVGFSGVLFHFSVLECNMSSNVSRSLFGMVNVPTFLYPWVLLVVLQFFMPHLSFLGHLSGIMTGTMQYYGLLDVITIGSELDDLPILSFLTQRSSFVCAPSSEHQRNFQEPSALAHSLRKGCHTIGRFGKYIVETFVVCIFGRGNSWNAIIRLPHWSYYPTSSVGVPSTSFPSSEGHVLGSSLEDDEEWGGLPTLASLEKTPLTSHVV